MRVMVINRAGDAGKTTFSKHCAKPRMKNAVCFAIEHAAQGNTALRAYADHKISAEDFPMVAESLVMSDIDGYDVLVDMGTSDRVAASESMDSMHDILSYFDVFVIPCKPNEKQVRDSIATANDLISRGIPANKIIVVRNSVRANKSDKEVYASIEMFANDVGICISKHFIPQQDIFGSVINHKESIPELASIDLKAVAPISTAELEAKKQYAKLVVMAKQAFTMNQSLDAVWSEVAAVAEGTDPADAAAQELRLTKDYGQDKEEEEEEEAKQNQAMQAVERLLSEQEQEQGKGKGRGSVSNTPAAPAPAKGPKGPSPSMM